MAPKVGIIGAGVSGLRCAAILLENGFEVTILEARDRIGGRITQSDGLSRRMDLGANWIHSTGHNPIVDLAKRTATPLHLWEQNTILVDQQGQLVAGDLANQTLERIWDTLEKAVHHSTVNSSTMDTSKSLYDFFNDDCQRLVQQGIILTDEANLFLGMAHMWGAYVGDRVERQSLKFLFLVDCIGGDDCFVASSYEKIMSAIAKAPLARAKVYLESVVSSVRHDAAEQEKVLVTTVAGIVHSFDEVVLTIPLGWLKCHKDRIYPLESNIIDAIDSISYGRLEKVFIEFSFAFWETREDPTDGQCCKPISFMHWLSPGYGPLGNSKDWRLEAVSFAAFPEPHRRPILLFYTYGDCSTYITNLIHGLDTDARARVLESIFEPYYARLPNYDKRRCAPLNFLATEWCKDEFAGYGSYSNFQVGMRDAANNVKALRHGMPKSHIYFAGEHTAPFDGLGTVAGAYTSGEDVAHRIADKYSPRSTSE
ncbi:hypothetical protein MMC25_005246 [Agyrium rufum]|nr:hypothetical protein [Agyrium rufum]